MFTKNEHSILDYLRTFGPSDLATVAQGCSLARSSAHAALQELSRAGIVVGTKRSGKTEFQIAPRDILERVVAELVTTFRTTVLTPEESEDRFTLVFTDDYVLPDAQLRQLKKRYDIVIHTNNSETVLDNEVFRERTANADVIVAFDNPTIDRDFLAQRPQLKAIVCPNCFPWNVDFEACAEAGVIVRHPDPSTQKYYTTSQTEHAVHAVLNMLRPSMRADVHEMVEFFAWRKHINEDLFGKRIGIIVGHSDVGFIVDVFRTFGCAVEAANILQLPPLASEFGLTRYLELEELWDQSDIVLVLAGATLDLDPLLVRERVPPYIVVMSTAVEFAIETVEQRINDGSIRGLALDALPSMWNRDSIRTALESLARTPNVFVTPEAQIFTHGSLHRSYDQVFEMLLRLEL